MIATIIDRDEGGDALDRSASIALEAKVIDDRDESDDEAVEPSGRALFVDAWLVRVNMSVLARHLEVVYGWEFRVVDAADWLVAKVGGEPSPFVKTDLPEWFASYESPVDLLTADEIISIDRVPLRRLRWRYPLKVAALRELAQEANATPTDTPPATIDSGDADGIMGASAQGGGVMRQGDRYNFRPGPFDGVA